MNKRILVCRVGWMDNYSGVGKDKLFWEGSELDVDDWWEVCNFKPERGCYYGGVYLERNDRPMSIHLERLGAGNADRLDGVLVVWAAVRPEHGLVVVGWYDNATVFRQRQSLRTGGGERHYYVTAKAADSELLEHDQRLLPVPTGKGYMGQQNTWFPAPRSRFATLVQSCIDGYRKAGRFLPEQAGTKPRPGRAWQPDLKKRLEVERAAVACVAEHYEKAGYVVESREKENVGWDLEARLKGVSLKLEVKGLSGCGGVTELTPNELEMCLKYRDAYRICVVTSALQKPRLHKFHYSEPRRTWVDDKGVALGFEVVTVATAHLSVNG